MTKGAMIAIRIMALSLSSFLLALMLSVLLRQRNGEPIHARRSTGSSRRSSVHRISPAVSRPLRGRMQIVTQVIISEITSIYLPPMVERWRAAKYFRRIADT